MFAPIGINKLYSPLGELIPARVAGELGMPVSDNIEVCECWSVTLAVLVLSVYSGIPAY